MRATIVRLTQLVAAVLVLVALAVPPPLWAADALRVPQKETQGSLEELDRAFRTAAGLEEFTLVMQLMQPRPWETDLIAFSPTHNVLVSGCVQHVYDRSGESMLGIRNHVWAHRIPTREEIQIPRDLEKDLSADRWVIKHLVFSPDGRRIFLHREAWAHDVEQVIAYDWETGRTIETITEEHLAIEDISSNTDGTTLYALCVNRAPPSEQRWMLHVYAVSVSGRRSSGQPISRELPVIVEASNPGKVPHRDAPSWVWELFAETVKVEQSEPHELLMSPDGRTLYVQYHIGNTLLVQAYDLEKRRPAKRYRAKIPGQPSFAQDNWPGKSMAVALDGATLYVGVQEDDDPLYDPVVAFDVRTGKWHTIMRVSGKIAHLAVTPNGVLTAVTTFVGGKEPKWNQSVRLLSVFQAVPAQGGAPKISGQPMLPQRTTGGLEEIAYYESVKKAGKVYGGPLIVGMAAKVKADSGIRPHAVLVTNFQGLRGLYATASVWRSGAMPELFDELAGIEGFHAVTILMYKGEDNIPSKAILLTDDGVRPKELRGREDVIVTTVGNPPSFRGVLRQVIVERLARQRRRPPPIGRVLGVFVRGDQVFLFA